MAKTTAVRAGVYDMTPDEAYPLAITLLASVLASGESVASCTTTMFDEDGTDVTATNLSGSNSISGDTITSPTITGLTVDTAYELEFKPVIDGRIYEFYVHIRCKLGGFA